MKSVYIVFILALTALGSATQAQAKDPGYYCEAYCFTRSGDNYRIKNTKPSRTVFGARWSLATVCNGSVEHPYCYYSYGDKGQNGN